AWIPRVHRRAHLPVRAGDRLVRVSAQALPADLLLPRDVVSGGDHPHRELRLPELHRAQPRRSAGGRPVPSPAGSRGGACPLLVAGAVRAGMDLLLHGRAHARPLEAPPPAVALARHRPGALPDREPLRALRGDDLRAVRDRVPGLARRSELDAVSVPLQAAGPEGRAWHLRAVPAALRVEPLVRLARTVARIPVGAGRRAAPARGLAAGPPALRRQSVPRRAADLGPGREVAVLVHDGGRE